MRTSELWLEPSQGAVWLRDEGHRASLPISRGFEAFPFETAQPVSFDPSACVRAGLKPLWPGVGVLGIAALTATGCSGKITRDVTATVLALEGSVFVQGSVPTEPPREVEPRAQIRNGETLRTGSEASVAVMLLPGALVQLGPSSAMRLEKLSITKDGNATDEAMSRLLLIRLLEGTVDIVLQFESKPGKGSVETPNGMLSTVLPGTCRLVVSQERTRVTCLRGAFIFANPAGQSGIEIERGCFREWPAENGDVMAVDTDARAQADVDQAMDVERNLLELQRRERFFPFPWRRL